MTPFAKPAKESDSGMNLTLLVFITLYCYLSSNAKNDYLVPKYRNWEMDNKQKKVENNK